MKIFLNEIQFSYRDECLKEGPQSPHDLEEVICLYTVIHNQDVIKKNKIELKPYQYKNMSKSEIENYIMIQEIGKLREIKV